MTLSLQKPLWFFKQISNLQVADLVLMFTNIISFKEGERIMYMSVELVEFVTRMQL
jgi:hypothetical protein